MVRTCIPLDVHEIKCASLEQAQPTLDCHSLDVHVRERREGREKGLFNEGKEKKGFVERQKRKKKLPLKKSCKHATAPRTDVALRAAHSVP